METCFVPIPINFINTKNNNETQEQLPNSGSHTMPTRRKCYPKAKLISFEPTVTKQETSILECEKIMISDVVNREEDDDIPPPLPPKSPGLLRRSQSRSDSCSSRNTLLTDNSSPVGKAFIPIDHATITSKPPLHRSNSMPCRQIKRKKQEGPRLSDISNSSFAKKQEELDLNKDKGLVEFKANGNLYILRALAFSYCLFRGTPYWCDSVRFPP